MSTKYTREQIDKARQLADHAFSETAHRNRQHDGDIVAGSMTRPADVWIDTFTEALGLDVEDEKPEPGTYFYEFETGSKAVVIDDHATMTPLSNVDNFLHLETYDPAKLTPARVVSEVEWQAIQYEAERRRVQVGEAERALRELRNAEPVELSEAVCVKCRLVQREHRSGYSASRCTFIPDAALAKHGHGRAEVTREQVRAGVDSACSDLFFSDEFKDMLTTRLTAALEASK